MVYSEQRLWPVSLGGQTQEEAADKTAGQDDVPFNEVCGLSRR